MKPEPPLDRTALVACLRQEYGLEMAKLEFLPEGMVGQNYLLTCREGQRYFFYRRKLEDLTDRIMHILYENTHSEQDEQDLAGIQEDFISGWPFLTNAVERMRVQLA